MPSTRAARDIELAPLSSAGARFPRLAATFRHHEHAVSESGWWLMWLA